MPGVADKAAFSSIYHGEIVPVEVDNQGKPVYTSGYYWRPLPAPRRTRHASARKQAEKSATPKVSALDGGQPA